MKLRSAFVSNSSSASFIIHYSKDGQSLSDAQRMAIRNHQSISKELGMDCQEMDKWDVTEKETYITASTYMDNFDMGLFLAKIGVSEKLIEVTYDEWGKWDE